MPKLLGITERYSYTFYSGWIADTRQNGAGVSSQSSFRHPLRLYVADIGDRLRTNMKTEGGFPPDRTATILQTGFHASFSRAEDYSFFFKGGSPGGSIFKIMVGGKVSYLIDTTEFLFPNENGVAPVPSYNYGIRLTQTPTEPIQIPSRMSFNVMLETSDGFSERMMAIESGQDQQYAEIKSFIVTTATREVQ